MSGQWIDVRDGMPDHGVTFLAVLDSFGERRICTMRLPVLVSKNERPRGDCAERVTHWMPLPPLPVEPA